MFKLEPLKYPYNGLEPYYDAKTVEIHYSKHHQAYVDNLNKALEKHPEFFEYSLDEILTNLDKIPDDIKTAVINNAGGDWNHNLFWEQFKLDANHEAHGEILEKIIKDFGSFENFKNEFDTKAKTNFGSGWTWLVIDANQKLKVVNTSGHVCPISFNEFPLFTIDIWEHTYYLKWQNRRPEWVETFWKILDWDFINQRYLKFCKNK